MELLVASALGLITAAGVYLMLRPRTFSVVLGLGLLGYAVNAFIFVMGGLVTGAPPIISPQAETYTDPLPQALVLTAIVIGFGMSAFVIELALRARHEADSDHVDAREPEEKKE